jgi:hypothetical protein
VRSFLLGELRWHLVQQYVCQGRAGVKPAPQVRHVVCMISKQKALFCILVQKDVGGLEGIEQNAEQGLP